MWFSFVKIITSVLCLDKFWKIYGTFISLWSIFWTIFSFISVVVCSVEFNLVLGAVWINDLFWLFGCIKWYETYRVDCSLYFLFEVILLNLNVVCVLSYLFLSKPWFTCCVLTKTYFAKIIKLSCEVNHVVLCSKTCK